MRPFIILAALAVFTPLPAIAASSCSTVIASTNRATKIADAALVRRTDRGILSAASKRNLGPVNIGQVMSDGAWRLIWVNAKDSERSVYFFRRGPKGGFNLIDTWGGVMAPDDRQGGIDWARKLKGGGTSLHLAGCFADAIVAESGG